MADMCRWSPKIATRKGTKIEETDSKLFQDIKESVKDYGASWKLWAYTKTSEFKKKYPNVQLDGIGEVTFPSLVEAMDLSKYYEDQKSMDEAIRDYGFNNKVFKDSGAAISAIEKFNANEKKYIATLKKKGDGYAVEVMKRSPISVEEAKEQSLNRALSIEILNLMRELGFTIDFADNPRYAGLFDPTNTTFREGLKTVIRIAKGERGEEALPEEFAHLIIEGLINHPLVHRLLATLDEEQIKNILNESYDQYAKEYDNDELKLKKEAAGKLLGDYIQRKGTLQKSNPATKKKGLLSRIWNWAKDKFSKVTDKQVSDIRTKAEAEVAKIYDLIPSGEVFHLIDKQNILEGDKLYFLDSGKVSVDISEDFDRISKVAKTAETIVGNRFANEVSSGHSMWVSDNTFTTIREMQNLNDEGDTESYTESVRIFMKYVLVEGREINKNIANIKKAEEEGRLTAENKYLLREISKLINMVRIFSERYKGIIGVIQSFYNENVAEEVGLTQREGEELSGDAAECMKLINSLESWSGATCRNAIGYYGRTVYEADKIRGIGSKRDEVMKLTEIIHHASRDINVFDRFLTSMSDADDALLTIVDSLVKVQQYDRDTEMIKWRAEIAKADKELRRSGERSDFMVEIKDGIPTGRFISEYDFDAYHKAEIEYIDYLKNVLKLEGQQFRDKLKEWKYVGDEQTKKRPRIKRVYLDPADQALYESKGATHELDGKIYEEMPNPEVFSENANRIENLNDAQRKYYDRIIQIKREMMLKIPHVGQRIYKSPIISKELAEGIFDNSTGNPLSLAMDWCKRNFVRRPDDIGFGTGEEFTDEIKTIIQTESDTDKAAKEIAKMLSEKLDTDVLEFMDYRKIRQAIEKHRDKETKKINELLATEEVKQAICAEGFYIVETDYANHRIQKVPIYYTRKIKDMRMMSTDVSSTMLAYSAMAVNYEKMNEIADILEVIRNYQKVREAELEARDKPVKSRFAALGKTYEVFVTVAGANTNTRKRLDDYIDSVLYEERKLDEGGVNILGTNIDIAKALDAMRSYTGLLMLGVNVFSTISNVAVGKIQQWIEAIGGEHFTVSNYMKGLGQYGELIWGHLSEMNSPVKKNKLSLLIEMFDPMGDYFEELRGANFNKNPVARILGNNMLGYIGMNAGEHLLHCTTMLAILNNIKLIDTTSETKKEVSLYDALKVVEEDGIYKLKLQEGLAYERDLINTDPLSKNYGRPILDENKKIKRELVSLDNEANKRRFFYKKKKIIRKVNDLLNGAYDVNAKGAAHRWALLRMLMQYRQWMPAHYERRFARAHYDGDLEQWIEGYYVTTYKFVSKIVKEIKNAEFNLVKYYGSLSKHEKANLKRAGTELGLFAILWAITTFGGRIKDRDRSWLDKMALYQINRMCLELGASAPTPAIFKSAFDILNSPMPTLSVFEKFKNLMNATNAFHEIQTGRYTGWSQIEKDIFELLPYLPQLYKAYVFDHSMFTMYE